MLPAMHPVAEQADRQQEHRNLQPEWAQLLGRCKDELASQKMIQRKRQNRQQSHGDDGGRGFAPKKPIVGNLAVAKFVIAVTRRQPQDTSVSEIELNGAPGLVLKVGERPIVAMLIETDGEQIQSVFAIANPDKLAAFLIA